MRWAFPIVLTALAAWQVFVDPTRSLAAASCAVVACVSALATGNRVRNQAQLFLLLTACLIFLLGSAVGWIAAMLVATGYHATGNSVLAGGSVQRFVQWAAPALYVAAAATIGWILAFGAEQTLLLLIAPLVGGLIGWGSKLALHGEVSEATEQGVDEMVVEAERALRDVNLGKARNLLGTAAQAAPERLDVARLQYSAWKYAPTSMEFNLAARNLLDLLEDDDFCASWKDYLAVTQMRPQLDSDSMLRMARRLARIGAVDEAAPIVNLFLQREPDLSGLDSGLESIMHAYHRAGDKSRAARYADLLVSRFPHSSSAGKALTLIGEVRGTA